MKKNICIIDDQWPAEHYPGFIDETKKLEESALKYLYANHNSWPEQELLNLTKELIDNYGSNWAISAFKNPQLYFNHIEEEIFSPDIIVFDWDYGVPFDSADALLKILESSYSIVAIYTGADKEGEVTNAISDGKFEIYKDRLKVIKKGETGAVQQVIEYCDQKFKTNFSYKFGQELKYNAIKSLDEILISISKLSYDEFICAFGHKRENGMTEISIKEFVEILSEKFKNHLANIEFTEEAIKPVDCSNITTGDDISRLWSYRMYYFPTDDLVRTGDIIQFSDSDEFTKYLVISADCHLLSFWKKNFGNLALVPLYEKDNKNTNLKSKLYLNKPLSKYKGQGTSSISNSWVQDSLSVVSSVPAQNDGVIKYKDYVIFPKEITTINIPPPMEANSTNIGTIRNLRLLYSHIKNKVVLKDRVNINEPFRTPLIQFVINNISGYGSPDYPHSLQEVIKAKTLQE